MACEKLGITLVKVENLGKFNHKILYTKEAVKNTRATFGVEMMMMMMRMMMMMMMTTIMMMIIMTTTTTTLMMVNV